MKIVPGMDFVISESSDAEMEFGWIYPWVELGRVGGDLYAESQRNT